MLFQGGGKRKHGRYEDYVDIGAGYDETDPFIDNTDAVSYLFKILFFRGIKVI